MRPDIIALRAAMAVEDRRNLVIVAEPEWVAAPSSTVESLARIIAAEQPVRLSTIVIMAALTVGQEGSK